MLQVRVNDHDFRYEWTQEKFLDVIHHICRVQVFDNDLGLFTDAVKYIADMVQWTEAVAMKREEIGLRPKLLRGEFRSV